MAQVLQNIWTSMKASEDQAQKLANYFNSSLVPAHRVSIVKFSDQWFSIVGTVNAKATADRLTKEIVEAQDKKEKEFA